MDTPTTVLMGATVGTALFGKRTGAAGVLVFTVGSLLPDLDQPFTGDRLGYIEWHRVVTHSFVGAAVQAVLIAGVGRLLTRRVRFPALLGLALGGILLAIATDVATWWGTVVWWPFSRDRVGIGLVFIIDFWLSAIVLSPFVAWGVRKLRGRTLPWRWFAVTAVLVPIWLLVCLGGRLAARSVLDDICAETGARAVDVFPQPFSPLRWSLAIDDGDRYRIAFVDLLHGREVVEERAFPKRLGGPAAVSDSTEEGKLLLWFYRLPVREIRELATGRTEVVYRDLAYEMRPAVGRSPPFRYRFVIEGERVVDQGWFSGEAARP